jgi:hypothetical protein
MISNSSCLFLYRAGPSAASRGLLFIVLCSSCIVSSVTCLRMQPVFLYVATRCNLSAIFCIRLRCIQLQIKFLL